MLKITHASDTSISAGRGTMWTVVVQNNMVTRHTGALAEAARTRGIPIMDISYIPNISIPDVKEPYFVYGSVGFVQAWKRKHPPAISWDEDSLSPQQWSEHVPIFLNKDGYECSFSEIPQGWHARPIINNKSFNGGIDVVADLSKDVRVWASPPKPIENEARTWFVKGRAVATRFYRGNPVSFSVPDIWLPFPDVVADWSVDSSGVKLIEFNSIHTSGRYGQGVPEAVLDALCT